MPRLIDADRLKKHYAWWDNEDKKIFDTIVDLQPTADAEPVVRCKDCKYYGTEVAGMPTTGYCKKTEFISKKENDYCSWGKRREDD